MPFSAQLHGCVNDVELMAEVLQSSGSASWPMTGSRFCATPRRRVRGDPRCACVELIAKAQPDDIVVVHYSGHGSQMT